jgi:hypothetical protein
VAQIVQADAGQPKGPTPPVKVERDRFGVEWAPIAFTEHEVLVGVILPERDPVLSLALVVGRQRPNELRRSCASCASARRTKDSPMVSAKRTSIGPAIANTNT